MKYKQKLEQTKQTSTEDLQSPAWKQQELNWDSTVNSQETTKLEVVGQKHTDKNCNTCGVALTEDNWNPSFIKLNITRCKTCNHPNRKKINFKSNPRRMYVNGKYISKKHPLHKPGRYKSFGDAAFSSLQNYELAKQGQVYVLVNPAFPGWCKIGMAVDAEDRLKQFQTGSPYRDYELIATYDTSDRRKAEKFAHDLLEKRHERRGEWFYIQHPVATAILELPMREHQ